MSEYKHIPQEELTLKDDFMFCHVVEVPEIYRQLINSLASINVEELHLLQSQQVIDLKYESHGVRLDVFASGQAIFYQPQLVTQEFMSDVEMQNTLYSDFERRIRYIQGSMDLFSLKPGTPYAKLPESYIVFVCTFDKYGEGKAVYEVESRIKGTDIVRQDGSHIYILNTKFIEGNAPKLVLDFLHYIETNEEDLESNSNFMSLIWKRVQEIRSEGKWKEDYSMYEQMKAQVRVQSYTQGFEQGTEQGFGSAILKLSEKYTAKQIAVMMDMPVEDVRKIIKDSSKDT